MVGAVAEGGWGTALAVAVGEDNQVLLGSAGDGLEVEGDGGDAAARP